MVCKCFQLGQIQLFDINFRVQLTHSHTITPFDAAGKQAF